MWKKYEELPKEFGISDLTISEGMLVLVVVNKRKFQVKFEDLCAFKVGFESDLHASMPDGLAGYASYSRASSYIEEFTRICDPNQRRQNLVHSVIFDFVSVVDVLSETLPRIEEIR